MYRNSLVAASAATALYICQLVNTQFVLFSFQILSISCLQPPPPPSSSSIQHLICYSFSLLHSAWSAQTDVVCAVLYASSCLSHLITVCYQYRLNVVLYVFSSILCHTFDTPYALIPLFSLSLISHSCVYVYMIVQFNECICSNYLNWACYTCSHSLQLRLIFRFFFFICSFPPFVIKICNTHLIWRNLMMCTHFILFAYLSIEKNKENKWMKLFSLFIERIFTITINQKSLNSKSIISFHTWMGYFISKIFRRNIQNIKNLFNKKN